MSNAQRTCRLIVSRVRRGLLNATNSALTAPVIDSNAIEYETRKWPSDSTQESKYRGPPNYERELAWKELERGARSPPESAVVRLADSIAGMAINVPREKLARLDVAGDIDELKTPSESNDSFPAYLGVDHQLYCLVSLARV